MRSVCRLVLVFLLALSGTALARDIHVATTAQLASAVADARPGDRILLADGVYKVDAILHARAAGTAAAPITVAAMHRWQARLLSTAVIAFEVTGAHWSFRDLDIRGVCPSDSDCEHAFHVVGADGFVLAGNRLVDFNAQLKVNFTDSHRMPADGLVEDNEVFNTHPRHTENPVTPLNMDHADRWVVRRNLIYDFHKDGGNGVSYGAFFKGGVTAPVFERNLVICARHDQIGGARIGLSFGGGGMVPQWCAPHFDAAIPCPSQVIGGVMRNNIIANCSDAGIYLNDATHAQILFNTLLRTGGIDVRFAGSDAELHGNLLAGRINARDGGSFADQGNLIRQLSGTLEAWYRDPDAGDLRLKGDVSALFGQAGADPRVTDDFCGRKRIGPADMGALQSSLGDCPTLR